MELLCLLVIKEQSLLLVYPLMTLFIFQSYPFNKSDSFSSAPFDLIHFDIWGPAPVPTEGGSKYFVIFVDDFSRYTWIYLLHHRSELVSIYQTFHKSAHSSIAPSKSFDQIMLKNIMINLSYPF